MSKVEKFFQVSVMFFLILIAGVTLGYAWRMSHEPSATISVRTIHLGDLSLWIGKKKEFFLLVDDNTQLHFLPLRKAQYEMAVRREKR